MLVTYYNRLDEAISDPSFRLKADLEFYAPVGAHALRAVETKLVPVLISIQTNERYGSSVH